MDLSVVIPAYNSEAYIADSVLTVSAFLDKKQLGFEIIVVDDGSHDRTSEIIAAIKIPNVKLITLPQNQGKFGALVAGMTTAQGRCKIFTDADIPFDLEAITYIHHLVNDRDVHLVIGDRALAESRYAVDTSYLRRVTTFVFSGLVRMFVAGGLFDTQCGLKGFRGDIANVLFPMLNTSGFSGDVELLYIALKYNLEIKRIPVRLRNAAPSSVRVLSHGLNMIRNIAFLKYYWLTGRYNSEGLEKLASQKYWIDQPNSTDHEKTASQGYLKNEQSFN